jgi:uncharacterized protein (TIGR00266 family)
MDFEILYRPAHALARVRLSPGESVVAEAGAMVGMSTGVQMQTAAGGVMKGLKRLFGGESFFRNTFTAQGGEGEVLLAHALSGDQVVLEVEPGRAVHIQSSSFIASEPSVELDTKVGGFGTFFAGEGLFVLKAHGQGQVLVGAFGGIEELACDGSLVIDTGHLVAWDASLQFSVGRSASGLLASFLSGEGLVCHFKGSGRIWIQTRNPPEFGRAVGKLLPPRRN